MPSPFPGMDPYLEGDDWTSFHAHLATDLQTCVRNVYDLGGFDLIVDYSKSPAVPLSAEQAAWVAERLRNYK